MYGKLNSGPNGVYARPCLYRGPGFEALSIYTYTAVDVDSDGVQSSKTAEFPSHLGHQISQLGVVYSVSKKRFCVFGNQDCTLKMK